MASEGSQSEGNPSGGNTNTSNADSDISSARYFPRVGAVDILSDWTDFPGWQSRTSRTLQIVKVADANCVVDPRFELHALSMLENRLSPAILRSGRKHTTFAALWKFLADYYQNNLVDRVDDIMDELLAIKINPGETASDYLTRVDGLVAQLDSAKHPYSVNRVGRAVVEGLGEPYSAKAGPLILMLDTLDIEALRRGFVKLGISGVLSTSARGTVSYAAAAAANSAPPDGYVCRNCNVPGHFIQNCTKPFVGRTFSRGGARGGRGSGRTRVQPESSAPVSDWALAAQERTGYTAAEIANARTIIDACERGDISRFLVDSGSSKHMCKDKQLFITLVPTMVVVVLGDGATLRVTEKGTVHLPTACGVMILTEVLHVPQLAVNLFSVGRASLNGARSTFLEHNDGVYVEKANRLLCTASFVQGLYWIDVGVPVDFANAATSRSDEAMMWHRRFGHLGFATLARMSSLNLITGSALKPCDFLQARSGQCEVCIETKQQAKPHTTPTSNPALQPLGRVFCDVTGNPTEGFYVTMLDEHTKWGAGGPVPQKTAVEVHKFVSGVVAMLEAQTGYRLLRFRTDGGREFDNAVFAKWLSEKGAIWEPTSRESPEQNADERLNRTVWDRVRPMMLSSGLGVAFLPYAFEYAIHVRNLSLCAGRKTTPHFAMFGVNVDASILREFGCPAWVFVPPGMRGNGKLQSRSVRGIFVGLGLPLGSSAYLVHLGTRVIRTSDVTFTELQSFLRDTSSSPTGLSPTVSTMQPSTSCTRPTRELEDVPFLCAVPHDPVGLAASSPFISEGELPVSVPTAVTESVCSHEGAHAQTGLSMPAHVRPDDADDLQDRVDPRRVLSFTPMCDSDSPDQVPLAQPAPYSALSPGVTVPLAHDSFAEPFSFPTNLPPLPPTPPDTPADVSDSLSALLDSPAPELLQPVPEPLSSLAPVQVSNWFQPSGAQFFPSDVPFVLPENIPSLPLTPDTDVTCTLPSSSQVPISTWPSHDPVSRDDFSYSPNDISVPTEFSAGDLVAPLEVVDQQQGEQHHASLKRAAELPRAPPSPFPKRHEPDFAAVAASSPAALFIPRTYAEAMAQPDSEQWRAAIDVELGAMEKHRVWKVVPLPPGKRAIGSRMIFDRKRADTVDGVALPDSTRKYKARLVAQGYTQIPGIDFKLTYAPVCKYATLRTVIASVANDGLCMKQFDVKTAFLHSPMDEEVYMKQPFGFDLCKPGECLLLLKALYGTRQAGKCFFEWLKNLLTSDGWVQAQSDPSMFLFYGSDGACVAVIYVDDGILAGPRALVDDLFYRISQRVEVTDLGEPQDFLGMHILRRPDGTIAVHQAPYVQVLVAKYKPTKTQVLPMNPRVSLVADGPPLEVSQPDYATLMGELQHLVNGTRPDIARPVSALSSYTKCPTQLHWEAGMQVIRYLHGTWGHGIIYGSSSQGLVGYSDSDFMGDSRDTRSTTGMLFTLYGGAVSWQSRLQPTIARSTCEAEYMAANAACLEALWLRKLMTDLGRPMTAPLMISCDNKATLALLLNTNMMSSRVKHIENRHHQCREQIELGTVSYVYCPSAENLADCLTKALPKAALEYQRHSMGLQHVF